MWLVLGQGQLRESGRSELQPGSPFVSGEVPKLEEEGVVVGEDTLLVEGPVWATGQLPWTQRDDQMVPGVGVAGLGTFAHGGWALETFSRVLGRDDLVGDEERLHGDGDQGVGRYKINWVCPRLSQDLGQGGVQGVPLLELGSGLKLRISGVFYPKIESRELFHHIVEGGQLPLGAVVVGLVALTLPTSGCDEPQLPVLDLVEDTCPCADQSVIRTNSPAFPPLGTMG